MKRKNFEGRQQQKRIDTLRRLGRRHGFDSELMLRGWTTELYKLPLHIQNLVRKIHGRTGL